MKPIYIFVLVFLATINSQSPITSRQLLPNLPSHAIQSIAALENTNNTVAVLITESSSQTTLLLYNTSDSNNQSSQLISSTQFLSGYYGRDLVAFSSNGVDWLAALFKIGNATQEVIGFFQPNLPNNTKLQSTIQGGYRTTIYPNANIECDECILVAMMGSDSTWTIKQIIFQNSTILWSHHIQEKYQQVFGLNIAIGIGYNKYVINLLAISHDGSYIFLAIDYKTKENVFYQSLYKTDAFISMFPFYTDYLAVAFTNSTLAILKNLDGQSLVQWQSSLPSGGVFYLSLSQQYVQVISCQTAYPTIACGNLRQTNSSLGSQISFWNFNMTANQTYVGSANYMVSDTNGFIIIQNNPLKYIKALENFITAPLSNQFIYADLNSVYVIDYSQVNSTSQEEKQ